MQLFPNGDFLLAALLFCREILAHLICKQIQQSGIASVNKNVLLFSTSGIVCAHALFSGLMRPS